MLEKAVLLLENWPAGLPEVPLAVNLSGPELLDDVFYEKLLRRFSESLFLRDKLKLELTETSVLASHDETKKRLSSLANVGATIIIDDFGTGHASLSQLIDLSASVLKVDREFVDRIESSERHRKIVRMTLELANALKMQAIAEGVETEAQLSLLKQMGFTCFQGYYFGKPAPIEHWGERLGSEAV
nr:EAL domain-containing protein [Lacimicrobium alkaliphilum]